MSCRMDGEDLYGRSSQWYDCRAQLFKKFNLDQNDPDLETSCFAIQDQQIHLTSVPVFQSNIGLDRPDPDTNFSRLPDPD